MAVFAFLANFANDELWRAHVIEMRSSGAKEDANGGVWSRQTEVRKVQGRLVETEAMVTAFDPPVRLAARRASGPVRPEAIYELRSTDSGTRLRFRLEVALAGITWLAWPLVMLFLFLTVRPALRSDFDRLRTLLESANEGTV